MDILVFGPDYGSAELETGVVKFTVAEARLLKFLSTYPGQTLSRGQIIDAIHEDGAAKSDRSVDFLVNRVRRKLGDDPRAPRFIETRYGGGYVWCGPAGRDARADTGHAAAVVGPLTGLDLLGANLDLGQAFAKALADALDSQIAGAVVLDTGRTDQGASEESTTRMQIELSYFRRGEEFECIITGKSRRSGQIFFLHRHQLIHESAPYRANTRAAATLVVEILAARWRKDLDHIANSEPVALAMHNAALEDRDNRISVDELDGILVRLRTERPEDPEIAILQASNLHSQVVARAGETFIKGLEACRKIDCEIERLVQGALSWCQDKPDKAMLVAKLLYYVDPGYKTLATELAEKAHRKSTAIASSLAIFGQLKNYFGETEQALDLLRQAEALTPSGSRFRHYVQVMLCEALVVARAWEELASVRSEITSYSAVARNTYEQIFMEPDQPSMRARGAALSLSKSQATARLRWYHRINAGLFEKVEHRETALRGILSLYVHRHGAGVVPPEVRASAPGLFRE